MLYDTILYNTNQIILPPKYKMEILITYIVIFIIVSQDPSISRRKTLKTVGGLLVAGSAVGTSAAKQSSNPTQIEKSLKKREKKDWSVSRWHEYLAKHDIPFAKEEKKPESDGASIQAISLFEEEDLTLTMTYYSVGSYDAIDLNWSFDRDVLDDDRSTGIPKDVASISWPEDHYSKPSEKDGTDMVETDGAAELPDSHDGITSSGCAVTWDGEFEGEQGWFTTYVDPNTSDYDADEREIYFDYIMTWEEAELSGISASSSGLSISISNSEQSWRVEPAYEENDLTNGQQFSEG